MVEPRPEPQDSSASDPKRDEDGQPIVDPPRKEDGARPGAPLKRMGLPVESTASGFHNLKVSGEFTL